MHLTLVQVIRGVFMHETFQVANVNDDRVIEVLCDVLTWDFDNSPFFIGHTPRIAALESHIEKTIRKNMDSLERIKAVITDVKQKKAIDEIIQEFNDGER